MSDQFSGGGGVVDIDVAGTTINPTNNVIPIRSNATTFVDSLLSQSAGNVVQASGSFSVPSLTTTAANGGLDGTEGTGAGLTAAAGHDLLWPDSTAHRWKMNNNNGGAVQVVASGADINTSDQVTITHIASATNNTVMKANATGNMVNSLEVDNGTTMTYTGTGGYSAPSYTATGSGAGFVTFTQGTAAGHATANTVTLEAPAAVTAYEILLPAAAATGIPHYANAAGVVTETISAINLASADVTGILPIANGGTGVVALFATNAQTSTYQVLAADFAACKTITVASGTFTITLVASGSQPTTGQCVNIVNYGAGVVTVARSGQNINGAAGNLTLNAGSATAPTSTFIVSDGTNYFATVDEGTTGTVTSVATTSPITGGTITGTGTIACATCVTSAAALTSTALMTGGGSQASQTPSATSTLSSGGNMSLAGTMQATTSYSAAATNTALVFQAGVDGTTQASTAAATFRGEDVTGGSTATLTGGAATLRGGDNASTGNTSIGGAVTVRGGDATGGTGTSDAGGAATIRAGNCTSTTGGCAPGALSVTSGGFTAAFTNGAASDNTIAAGLGTGNAAVAHVKLQSPALGLSSGSTAQTQVTRWVNHTKAGSTTSATATTMFNVASATNTAWGVEVLVHVDLISSTPNVCGTTERFSLTGTNNNGTFGTVNIVAGTLSTLCSTGTLTLAVTATAANPSVVSVTPTWATITSITSSTITVQINNVSQQEIALL